MSNTRVYRFFYDANKRPLVLCTVTAYKGGRYYIEEREAGVYSAKNGGYHANDAVVALRVLMDIYSRAGSTSADFLNVLELPEYSSDADCDSEVLPIAVSVSWPSVWNMTTYLSDESYAVLAYSRRGRVGIRELPDGRLEMRIDPVIGVEADDTQLTQWLSDLTTCINDGERPLHYLVRFESDVLCLMLELPVNALGAEQPFVFNPEFLDTHYRDAWNTAATAVEYDDTSASKRHTASHPSHDAMQALRQRVASETAARKMAEARCSALQIAGFGLKQLGDRFFRELSQAEADRRHLRTMLRGVYLERLTELEQSGADRDALEQLRRNIEQQEDLLQVEALSGKDLRVSTREIYEDTLQQYLGVLSPDDAAQIREKFEEFDYRDEYSEVNASEDPVPRDLWMSSQHAQPRSVAPDRDVVAEAIRTLREELNISDDLTVVYIVDPRPGLLEEPDAPSDQNTPVIEAVQRFKEQVGLGPDHHVAFIRNPDRTTGEQAGSVRYLPVYDGVSGEDSGSSAGMFAIIEDFTARLEQGDDPSINTIAQLIGRNPDSNIGE